MKLMSESIGGYGGMMDSMFITYLLADMALAWFWLC